MSKREVKFATPISTPVRSRGGQKRPQKPYPEFPLYAHPAGVWAKNIRGKKYYFGPWSNPQAALDRYLREREFLYAGQELPPESDGVTLDELVNRFLDAQRVRMESGDITIRMFQDYKRDGERILDTLGRARPVAMLRPEDFGKLRAAMFAGRNATTSTNIIIRQRSIFKWGHSIRLLVEPVNFGGAFALPAARLRRRALRSGGPKDLSAKEILKMLDAAEKSAWGQLLNLRAMILLGINAGLGNTDCSALCSKHVDLAAGVLDFPRPKTEANRRAMLWPETVAAIKEAMEHRRQLMRSKLGPEGYEDRLFMTKRQRPYTSLSGAEKPVDSVGMEFRRLAAICGVHRKGIGFYSLRHTFQTVADETKDFPAIDLIMGHVPASADMAAVYRERISDERLSAVCEHVRVWLFGPAKMKRPARRKAKVV